MDRASVFGTENASSILARGTCSIIGFIAEVAPRPSEAQKGRRRRMADADGGKIERLFSRGGGMADARALRALESIGSWRFESSPRHRFA